jgi:hypothetical protein
MLKTVDYKGFPQKKQMENLWQLASNKSRFGTLEK